MKNSPSGPPGPHVRLIFRPGTRGPEVWIGSAPAWHKVRSPEVRLLPGDRCHVRVLLEREGRPYLADPQPWNLALPDERQVAEVWLRDQGYMVEFRQEAEVIT